MPRAHASHYARLGLDATVDSDEVNRKFKYLALEMNPNNNRVSSEKHSKDEIQESFVSICRAFQIIVFPPSCEDPDFGIEAADNLFFNFFSMVFENVIATHICKDCGKKYFAWNEDVDIPVPLAQIYGEGLDALADMEHDLAVFREIVESRHRDGKYVPRHTSPLQSDDYDDGVQFTAKELHERLQLQREENKRKVKLDESGRPITTRRGVLKISEIATDSSQTKSMTAKQRRAIERQRQREIQKEMEDFAKKEKEREEIRKQKEERKAREREEKARQDAEQSEKLRKEKELIARGKAEEEKKRRNEERRIREVEEENRRKEEEKERERERKEEERMIQQEKDRIEAERRWKERERGKKENWQKKKVAGRGNQARGGILLGPGGPVSKGYEQYTLPPRLRRAMEKGGPVTQYRYEKKVVPSQAAVSKGNSKEVTESTAVKSPGIKMVMPGVSALGAGALMGSESEPSVVVNSNQLHDGVSTVGIGRSLTSDTVTAQSMETDRNVLFGLDLFQPSAGGLNFGGQNGQTHEAVDSYMMPDVDANYTFLDEEWNDQSTVDNPSGSQSQFDLMNELLQGVAAQPTMKNESDLFSDKFGSGWS